MVIMRPLADPVLFTGFDDTGSANRQTVKFTEYIGDQIQEVCLGCRLSQFVDAVIELSHSTLAEVKLPVGFNRNWCWGHLPWRIAGGWIFRRYLGCFTHASRALLFMAWGWGRFLKVLVAG